MLAGKDVRYWDAIAASWQKAHPQTLWRVHCDTVNTALLARWLPADRAERLLKTDLFDEAFGDGIYPLLRLRACTVVGVDISVLSLSDAVLRYPHLRTTLADVRHLPFLDGTFDVVVSNSTLDHFGALDEMVAALRELGRVLRAGGQLLLTLDNLANPVIALRNLLPFPLLNSLGLVPYYIGATCGPLRLGRILRQVGFEVLEISAVMHCPRVLAVSMAGLLERNAGRATQSRFLSYLTAFERLSHWPTRFLTGHFIAVRAKRSQVQAHET